MTGLMVAGIVYEGIILIEFPTKRPGYGVHSTLRRAHEHISFIVVHIQNTIKTVFTRAARKF